MNWQAFVDRCRPLLVGARFIVIDFTAMTRYDADIRHVAREAMMQWRAYGIELVLGISESHVARILGTTLGVATNLPLRFVGSVEEAAARLSSMRQHPRPQGAPR